MTPHWLTTREVADALGVTPRRVRALAKSRGIKPLKVGSACLWPPSAPRLLKPMRTGRPRKA